MTYSERGVLRNETLNVVGDVTFQSFVTALRVTLDRYHFGKLIRLKFYHNPPENMLTMWASINYPTGHLRTQESIAIEQIRSENRHDLVRYIVYEIIHRLAVSQEESKAS